MALTPEPRVPLGSGVEITFEPFAGAPPLRWLVAVADVQIEQPELITDRDRDGVVERCATAQQAAKTLNTSARK